MREFLALLAAASLLVSMTACGSSAAPEVSDTGSGEVREETMEQIDMLYYLDLGGGSLMAACYTSEGIERLGRDYYVVLAGDADIYNAAGEEIPLKELVRGCPIRVSWPGAVAESYPAQIGAATITALSDTPDASVPPEDEIEPIDGGPKWWVKDPVTEVPDLMIQYASSAFSVTMRVEKRYGSWVCGTPGEGSGALGRASNTMLDGLSPQKWPFDDSNTIRRGDFDTLTLSWSPQPQSIAVTAYEQGGGDSGTDVSVAEDGTMALLDGAYIYVVSTRWDTEEYSGDGTYGFLVTAPES